MAASDTPEGPRRRRGRRVEPEETLDPGAAPPVPDPADPAAEARPGARALRRAAEGGRLSWTAGLFWTGLGGVLVLALGLALDAFLADLAAAHPALAWAGAGLLAALALALLAMAVRELAALARLGRIEGLRRLAETAREVAGPGPARALVAGLSKLYAGRAEVRAEEAAARAEEMLDGPEILKMAERRMMPALDAEAERAVSRAARRVAGVTALLPMALVDLLAVLVQNVVMIRTIAEIYGGRAGWLGSWRLLKAVAQHLVATGAISATDDLLGPLVGGGLLGQVSRRFGEAAVNAALTARVGTAAIEVCRPLPFAERPAPRASALVRRALTDWSPAPGR